MARVMSSSSSVVAEYRVSLVCVDARPTFSCDLNLCHGAQPVPLGRPREEGLDSHFSGLDRLSDNARLASVSFIMYVRSLENFSDCDWIFVHPLSTPRLLNYSRSLSQLLFDVGISLAPLFCAVSFVTCTTRPPSSLRAGGDAARLQSILHARRKSCSR